MGDLFASVELKLDRAAHHLDVLKTALDSFLYGNPETGARLVVQSQPPYAIWKAMTYRPDDVPLAWSVQIGEAVYQLRSSLDHLVNGLIPESTRDSGFPIYCDEPSYDANAARLMPDLPVPYLAMVRELQPFRQNPTEPMEATLWNLNEWARLDRHRFLHVTDVFVIESTVTSVPPGRITLDYSVSFPSPLEDGAVIGAGQVIPDDDGNTEVEVHLHAIADLVLAQIDDMRIPPGQIAVLAAGGLERFVAHVREIVTVFGSVS